MASACLLTAKAKAEKRDDTAETNAADAECKKQQAADAAKFAQDYKNWPCVKSQEGERRLRLIASRPEPVRGAAGAAPKVLRGEGDFDESA